MSAVGAELDATVVKRCCVAAYEQEWLSLLLGESYHPGGRRLTFRLAEAIGLESGERVLDVASGAGATAFLLAREFGARVVGVDLGERVVAAARGRAAAAGLAGLVVFAVGDAERLPLEDGSVDAALSECSLCLFPDKEAAAAELGRVLRPAGRVGITDVRASPEALPEELRSLAARVACVADARPLEGYVELLEDAGLRVTLTEPHDRALEELLERVEARLAALGLLLPGAFDLGNARRLLGIAAQAVRDDALGYGLIVAVKP